MQSVGLTLLERLEVVSHLHALKSQQSEDRKPQTSRLAIKVSNERLLAAGTNPDEWLMYSGSYNGWRHTPLAEITPANVAQLKLSWVKQFDINEPNIEATPLVIGRAIFTTTDPGDVIALNAKTGATIWEYKRAIPSGLPVEFRVNRGLAVQGSTLFLGSLEGYLVAINANDGKLIWQTVGCKSTPRVTRLVWPPSSSIIPSWSGSPEASSELGDFSPPMTYRAASSSGDLTNTIPGPRRSRSTSTT